MTGDQIRSVAASKPFRPFRVNMANGKSVDVPHPDFFYVSPDGLTLIVYRMNTSFEIIDSVLVTSIETLPKNGSRMRRRKKSR